MSAYLEGRELKVECGGCGRTLVLAHGSNALVADPNDKKWYGAAVKVGWRKFKRGAECDECAATPMRLARRWAIINGKVKQ